MLKNKIDFAVVFSVKNANPNGDPLGGNRPRTTSDGLGEVTDVCLKRKIRNRLQEEGNEIFVQSDENVSDGKETLSERFNDYLKEIQADNKNKLTREEVSQAVCKKWFDVRSFGQVFAFKKRGEIDEVSLGIRGPVTIQSAFSVEPILIESIQITKSVSSEKPEKGSKSSDTMGTKHRVSNSVYVTYGSISPQLAEKTKFSNDDAIAIKKALSTLFVGDESSARPSGSMEVLHVIWWNHNNKYGQHSSVKVHKSLVVKDNGDIYIEELEGLKPEIIKG